MWHVFLSLYDVTAACATLVWTVMMLFARFVSPRGAVQCLPSFTPIWIRTKDLVLCRHPNWPWTVCSLPKSYILTQKKEGVSYYMLSNQQPLRSLQFEFQPKVVCYKVAFSRTSKIVRTHLLCLIPLWRLFYVNYLVCEYRKFIPTWEILW